MAPPRLNRPQIIQQQHEHRPTSAVSLTVANSADVDVEQNFWNSLFLRAFTITVNLSCRSKGKSNISLLKNSVRRCWTPDATSKDWLSCELTVTVIPVNGWLDASNDLSEQAAIKKQKTFSTKNASGFVYNIYEIA